MEFPTEQAMEFSYAAIDQEIKALDLTALRSNTLLAVQGSRIQRMAAIYRGVRPLLVALGAFGIIPSYWRAAVQFFVAAVDEVVANTPVTADDPRFKAGKDL